MRLPIENEEDMLLLNQCQMDTLKNIELTYQEIEDRSIYPFLKSLEQAMRK